MHSFYEYFFNPVFSSEQTAMHFSEKKSILSGIAKNFYFLRNKLIENIDILLGL